MEQLELTVAQREFHSEEFKKLNGEIAELIKSIAHMFSFAVGSSGALFAWLLTTRKTVPEIGLAIPALLTIVLAVMAYAQAERITQIGNYLRRLEDVLGHPELGWEEHFRKEGAVVGNATMAAWIILFVCDVVAAVLIARSS